MSNPSKIIWVNITREKIGFVIFEVGFWQSLTSKPHSYFFNGTFFVRSLNFYFGVKSSW